MNELSESIDKIIACKPYKFIISNPINKVYSPKISASLNKNTYICEKISGKQAFHENIPATEIFQYIYSALTKSYRQLDAWTADLYTSIKISKKGKILVSRSKNNTPPKVNFSHNRKKNYILNEGEVIPPLVDMGIFTAEGKVVSSMQDKFRQINRFVEIIDDELKNSDKKSLNIIDFGCGKSYLTFILYYYLTYIRGFEINMTGLDLKKQVIENCSQTAEKYGYKGLKFMCGDISSYTQENPVDMVVSLHACDTATDYALFNAVKWNTNYIFSVPCCQHEINAQISGGSFSALTRYGIIKERTSALITDAIRADILEYCGYKTQVLEFTDLGHTPKNLLIRAVKSNISNAVKEKRLEEIKNICNEFKINPTICRLILDNGKE